MINLVRPIEPKEEINLDRLLQFDFGRPIAFKEKTNIDRPRMRDRSCVVGSRGTWIARVVSCMAPTSAWLAMLGALVC